jgi:putative endonuclease
VAADPLKGGGVAAAGRGRAGEDLACAYLRRLGFRILERNYRCRAGEIDVVARDGETWVFVEVKERSNPSHGAAVDAVTPAKRRRVVRAARLWAAAHGASESPLRFDVVAVDRTGDETRIRHERAAFDAGGGG